MIDELPQHHLLVMEDDELFNNAAEIFAQSAVRAVETSGRFSVALAGGSTPARLYGLLAERYSISIPWGKVQVFFGDERCVPPDHKDSNYRMAEENLLSKVDIPRENIHRIQGELDPKAAAELYANEMMKIFGTGPEVAPAFDLMLLGMGEDAHTASIFPGSDAVSEDKLLAATVYVPKLDSYRVTLTPPVIRRAKRILVLVTGENKAEALEHALRGPYAPEQFPIQILRDAKGEVTWLADPPAASNIILPFR